MSWQDLPRAAISFRRRSPTQWAICAHAMACAQQFADVRRLLNRLNDADEGLVDDGGGTAGLPDDLASQHAELRDLLNAGDLVGKLAQINAITSAIVA